jgi:spore coat protein U-like protein
MKSRRYLISLALVCSAYLLLQQNAFAVISCNISSPGFSVLYDPLVATPNDSVSSVTINCTRALADPSTQTYTLEADNGLNPQGQSHQASGTGGGLIKYTEYQDAAYATRWSTAPPAKRAISGTINFGGGTSTSINVPIYARIAAAQAVAADIYTDTVTMTLTYGTATALGTHPVTITTIPQCIISSPPGNIVFSYTSFQVTNSVASTTFATQCTTNLAYTFSLDADVPMLGLTYTLTLPVTSGTGTGVAQTFNINGTITAGQGGVCTASTCSGTATRLLTITF